jgi:exopolyphosphatase / guanosine-5'-triphosphate,3'-diphosphate pyrophosphatase
MLMEEILKTTHCQDVIFSAYGIREGYLFSLLSKEEQKLDPLIAGCYDMVSHIGENPAYSLELLDWMESLFLHETEFERRLRLSCCILSGIARFEHTEYRAEIAFRRFVDSAITGVSHQGRLFIARALYHRYQSRPIHEIAIMTDSLLEDDDIIRAKTIGLAMRLAHNIAAGAVGILPHVSITVMDQHLLLAFKDNCAHLMGESVQKRLNKLAEHLKLNAKVVCL